MGNFGNLLSVASICWLILLLAWLISSFFVKRSVTGRGSWWIIWRVLVALFVLVFVRTNHSGGLSFIQFLLQSSFQFPIPGSIFTVIGLLGALWARNYLGRNWSGYVTYKEDQDLVTTGPYRFVRHPIYTSIILMFIGTILYYGTLFIAIMFLIAAISFILRTGKEEAIMVQLFGQKYRDYMQRTKRLIPWVY